MMRPALVTILVVLLTLTLFLEISEGANADDLAMNHLRQLRVKRSRRRGGSSLFRLPEIRRAVLEAARRAMCRRFGSCRRKSG
ncbi:hypothetical protein ACOMHN_044121 [Nucella lapillus]